MSDPKYKLYSIEWDPNGQSYLDWGRVQVVDYLGKPAFSLEKHDYGLDNTDTV